MNWLENVEILDSIPYEPDIAQIMKMLPMRADKQRFERIVRELLEIVVPIARPKSVYRVCCVEKIEDDSATIEGIKFTSHILRDKLENVERVFPVVSTCGREVDSIKLSGKDLIRDFCLDMIKNTIVFAASQYVNKYLTQRFDIKQLSSLNPGEMESWPITQLRNIFLLLGDVEAMIGVTLTEQCALVPVKSGAGILFPTETQFFGCQLCPQRKCMGRRTAFDPELAEKYREKARGTRG